jgi:hypothetical protein
MKKNIILLVFFLIFAKLNFAQSVTIDPNAATNGSALIKAQSTTAGTLIPNVSAAQRAAIATPTKGLLVFDTDSGTFWFHNGTDWVQLVAATSNWTPYNGNTELSSNNYARFNLGNGTNTTALASGVGTEGTLKINSPSPITASKYLSLDGNSIQARRINVLTDFKTENNLLLNPFGGNVGIGLASPNAPLQFTSTSGLNRKIVLYEEFNNNHQFYGFGINDGILRYQTTGGGDHVFYSATSASSSKELMRVKYDGNLKVSEGIYSNQMGGLNIVPIGISTYNASEDLNGAVVNVNFNNIAGGLIESAGASTIISFDDNLSASFKLVSSIVNQYTKIIAISAPSYTGGTAFDGIPFSNSSPSGFIGEIKNGINVMPSGINAGTYFYISVVVDDFPLLGGSNLSGTVIFYGIK